MFPLGCIVRHGPRSSPRVAVEETGRLVIMKYLSSPFSSSEAQDTYRFYSREPFEGITSIEEFQRRFLWYNLGQQGCESIDKLVTANDKDRVIDASEFRQSLNLCFQNRAIRRVLVVDSNALFREETLKIVTAMKEQTLVSESPPSVADFLCMRILDKAGWPHLEVKNVASEIPEVLDSAGFRAFAESVKAFGAANRREFSRLIRWANILRKVPSVSLVSHAMYSPHNFALDAVIGSTGRYLARFWNYHGEPSLTLCKEALIDCAPQSFRAIDAITDDEIWRNTKHGVNWDVLKLVKLAYMEAIDING